MSALTQNSVASTLNVFSNIALEQMIASMPKLDLFTKLFDSEIANGGQALITRLPNTQFQTTPSDLTQIASGNTAWNPESGSVNNITINLGLKARAENYDELQWATLTDTNIRNWFLPQLAKQTANDIVVNVLNNVTSSVFTTTLTVPTSSNFAITGALSLQQADKLLAKNEIDENNHFFIANPDLYQSLTANLVYQLFENGVVEPVVSNNTVRQVSNFKVARYARLYNASLPWGGQAYGNSDKMVGLAGHSQGLVAAIRQPVPINAGTTWSANAVDQTSGISLQVRLMYDPSMPVWRLAVLAVYGSAAGNPKAIIPVITQST